MFCLTNATLRLDFWHQKEVSDFHSIYCYFTQTIILILYVKTYTRLQRVLMQMLFLLSPVCTFPQRGAVNQNKKKSVRKCFKFHDSHHVFQSKTLLALYYSMKPVIKKDNDKSICIVKINLRIIFIKWSMVYHLILLILLPSALDTSWVFQ